jgi:hypothetical protein
VMRCSGGKRGMPERHLTGGTQDDCDPRGNPAPPAMRHTLQPALHPALLDDTAFVGCERVTRSRVAVLARMRRRR